MNRPGSSNCSRIWRRNRLTPRFRDFRRRGRRGPNAHDRLSGRDSINRLQHEIRYLIRLEPGVQTPEETLRLAAARAAIGLAAGAGAAPPGSGGTLCLGLPHPTQARREGARRSLGNGARFHRPARLVRGLSPGRWLDRTGSDLGFAGRRRSICRWRARPSRPRAAPVSGTVEDCEVEFEHAMRSLAHLRISARHPALHRRAVAAHSTSLVRRSTRPAGAWTCA